MILAEWTYKTRHPEIRNFRNQNGHLMKIFIDFVLVGDLEEDEGDGSDSENSAAVTDSEVSLHFLFVDVWKFICINFKP